jgi:3-hydroxybutyryl-CoA dehydrogenase
MKKVSVIGAGTMGNGIAHVFAQSGFNVTLIDVSENQLQKALNTIAKNLDRQVAKGTLTDDQKKETLAHITTKYLKILAKQRQRIVFSPPTLHLFLSHRLLQPPRCPNW